MRMRSGRRLTRLWGGDRPAPSARRRRSGGSRRRDCGVPDVRPLRGHIDHLHHRRLRNRAVVAVRNGARRAVAVLGLGAYAATFLTALSTRDLARAVGATIASAAFVFSAYLVYVQLALIGAVCDWCVVNDAVVTALLPFAVWRIYVGAAPGTRRRRRRRPGRSVPRSP
jgi:Vitamin K epoxide reductase family